jgi:hypothetical protein
MNKLRDKANAVQSPCLADGEAVALGAHVFLYLRINLRLRPCGSGGPGDQGPPL